MSVGLPPDGSGGEGERVPRPALPEHPSVMDRVMNLFGVRLGYTLTDEEERFEVHLPGWMARRPWIVSWWTRAGVRAVREIYEEERKGGRQHG